MKGDGDQEEDGDERALRRKNGDGERWRPKAERRVIISMGNVRRAVAEGNNVGCSRDQTQEMKNGNGQEEQG